MRDKGKLVTWNDDRGYGFIAPYSGAVQVFVHVKAFGNRTRRPELDDVVTYTLARDKQGRPRAVNAALAGASGPARPERKSSAPALLVSAIFLSVVGGAVLVAKLSPAILLVYLAASMVTFIAYAIDKSAAKKGRWRTSEGTLHLLSLIGGWPGALIAQSVLRHKSRKQPFRVIFWLTVILNCTALAWLSTPGGRAAIDSLHAHSDQPRLTLVGAAASAYARGQPPAMNLGCSSDSPSSGNPGHHTQGAWSCS